MLKVDCGPLTEATGAAIEEALERQGEDSSRIFGGLSGADALRISSLTEMYDLLTKLGMRPSDYVDLPTPDASISNHAFALIAQKCALNVLRTVCLRDDPVSASTRKAA